MSDERPVLVTGASGFIGRHLCRHLLAANRPLRRFSRSKNLSDSHAGGDSATPLRSAQNDGKGFRFAQNDGKRFRSERNDGEGLGYARDGREEFGSTQNDGKELGFGRQARDTCISGDILDFEVLREACEGVGVVFHLAGVAQTAAARNPPAMRTNLEGGRNLLAAARAAGAKRLVFVSSARAAEFDHDRTPARAGDYARSKWEAERLMLEANGADGLLTTVLRPAPVYGPGMQGGIARMIRLIHARRLPPLPKLDRSFSLVGVDDVCRAAILASESLLAPGQCWLLTDLHRYTANAVEQAVYDALDRKKPGWHTPAVVFFAAAAMLQAGRLVGWEKAESGLQTWRNLTSESTWPAEDIFEELGFRPSGLLYERLPEIIRDLTGQQPAPREKK